MPLWNEEFLEAYLPEKGRTAINIGAHEGHWCRKLSPRFEKVIAIEASPESVVRLSAQQIPNVQVLNAAAWICGQQRMQFHVRREAQMSSALACRDIQRDAGVSETIEVNTVAIDFLNLDQVDLMIIDVEGAEVQVMQGATRTVERCRPDLIIECHEREHRDWLSTWLERAGYNLAHVHEPQRDQSDEWGRHVYLVGQYYRPRS